MKKLQNINLYKKFFLAILFLGLFPMLIFSTVIMNWMFQEYRRSLHSNYEQATFFVNDSINNILENYNGISKIPYYYNYSNEGQFEFNYMFFDNLRRIVYGIGIPEEQIEGTRLNNMQVFLGNVQSVDDFIQGVHFLAVDEFGKELSFHRYMNRAQILSSNEIFQERMNYKNLDFSSKNMLLIPTHKNDYFHGRNSQVFTIGRNYFDLTGEIGKQKYVGTLFIDIDLERLSETTKQIEMSHGERIYIYDEDGICYYSNDETMIGKNLKKEDISFTDSEKEIVIQTAKNSHNFQVLITMKTEIAYQKLKQMQVTVYVFLFICLIGLMLSTVWFSKQLTNPIRNMMKQMSEIESGNFKVELLVSSRDEIGILSERFNQMSRELENYINQSYVARMKQAEAEMTALKSQIYPHFLYNTLEVIRMTAVEKDELLISKMIEALSEQIHYMIGPMQDIVPLEKEVEITKKYIYLLNCRIKGEVNLSVNLQGCEMIQVPKLILQPIVENAYIHGIKHKSGVGNIMIGAERLKGSLEIFILDNGVGMDEVTLKKLSVFLEGDEPGIKNKHNWQSIGLKNVHDRIRYLYGKPYGIEITSTSPIGTMVRIVMPDQEEVFK